jgi:excisionase family DNA binding protein
MRQESDSEPQARQWVTLGEAADVLGVHPSTLRRWVDHGEIRCMRTPGGHRRFLKRDLDLFLDAQTEAAQFDVPESLTQSLVLHTRRELPSGRITETSWHKAFDEGERASRRASGRRLLGLAIQFTSRTKGRETILEEARRIGRTYGKDAVERGLPLVDTIRAFLFFREALIRSARPGLVQRGRYDDEDVHIHRSLRGFLDEVLFAAMAAYDEGLHRSLPFAEGSE